MKNSKKVGRLKKVNYGRMLRGDNELNRMRDRSWLYYNMVRLMVVSEDVNLLK